MNQKRILVIPFKDLHIEDVPIVGGKNASLGEMYRELNKKGVTVPNGFAITALAYRYFIESAGLKDKIHKILSDLDTTSIRNLMKRGKKVRGEKELLKSCKKCFASLFTNRAISYRVDKGFDHFTIALSIGVQKMVRSDLSSSGVMFSIDTESGFKDAVFITSI